MRTRKTEKKIVEKLARSVIKEFCPRSWRNRRKRNDLAYSLKKLYFKNIKIIKRKIAPLS